MSLQNIWAKILGFVLLIVGIIGFFNNPVLGIFGVDTLHNLVHVITGIFGIWVGFGSLNAATNFNKWFGVIYLLVAILGFLNLITFMTANMADHWLHLL